VQANTNDFLRHNFRDKDILISLHSITDTPQENEVW